MALRRSLTRSALALLLAAVGGSLGAQAGPPDSTARDPHAVQPERPTVATHAGTVARGWFELEEGGEWDKSGDDQKTFFAPTNLKIGLASKAQLNILFNVIDDRSIRSGNLTASDVTIGVKYQ